MYNVVLLIERQLIELDANQIVSLQEGVDDDVTYHLLLPIESSAAVLGSSMSALGGGQFVPMTEPDTMAVVDQELHQAGEAELDESARLLRDRGQQVTARLTDLDPIDALKELVTETSADEVIILTEPHLVREFLKLDWTSRARRSLDVPTLHLLEHLPFEAQTEI
ncbi:hypothetical protein JL108_16330 [Aeromicrobium sp. YIM 150415]|uniref:Indole-3-glycerol phosphate synthase n=1 Tax=Aeromicrobium piscarium TaxID=2590901 RepID=A0A554SA27_9ACTN|nr:MULTISPECIES: hypothetical protein [Aeromicrobium]MBM9465017.1 hypothetical protein [Aeromicrobium sp. YIM 150415]TSD63183.1 hypothetical protein FNM00_09720 [Aeromicrobium piscarium]